MLLIDATNLNTGGGGALLGYLLESISDRSFKALVSANTGIRPSSNIIVTDPCNPLGRTRQSLLENAVRNYNPSTVLCFGNLPPRRRLSVSRTVTYFQNAHLVSRLDRQCRYGTRDRLRYLLLRRSIRTWLAHTDVWLFQTRYIGDAFQQEYGPIDNLGVFPFFDESKLRETCDKINQGYIREGFIYASAAGPHKNHRNLLTAWKMLKDDHALTPLLHLTIPSQNVRLIKQIDELNTSGLNIRNHGIIPRESVLELTASCEFVVFPSLLETLGLGIVEGCLLGCKVLVSNDRAFAEVIEPSYTFEPLSPASIADCVATAIGDPGPRPMVLLRNRIDELIALLFS